MSSHEPVPGGGNKKELEIKIFYRGLEGGRKRGNHAVVASALLRILYQQPDTGSSAEGEVLIAPERVEARSTMAIMVPLELQTAFSVRHGLLFNYFTLVPEPRGGYIDTRYNDNKCVKAPTKEPEKNTKKAKPTYLVRFIHREDIYPQHECQ